MSYPHSVFVQDTYIPTEWIFIALVNANVNDLILGILQNTDGGSSCHCVADNFDVNEDTKTGHDRTHVMGIIAWKSG